MKKKERKMGMIKDHYHEFLENGGAELGFSMACLPDRDDLKDVLINQIDAQVYIELKEECE